MKALTFQGKQSVEYVSVPDPSIEDSGDVIVRVAVASVCGSDLHPYHEREKGLDPGTVMGHEAVGEVVEVGRAVTRLKKGDRVFGPFTTNCGRCEFCRSGLTCRCEQGQLFGWVSGGKGLQGLQAEFARVPLAESTLLEVPEGLGDETALLLGDVLSTGSYCAEMAGVRPGGTYVVVGCGPVGLMAVAGAKRLGAERVIAVDQVPERLRLAEYFGAETTQDIPPADGVMECVGSLAAHSLAWRVVKPGGTIAVAGVHTGESFGFSPEQAYAKNLTYRVGRCPARSMAERLLPWVRESGIDFTKVFSHHLPLSSGKRAYEMFDKKAEGCTKILLGIS